MLPEVLVDEVFCIIFKTCRQRGFALDPAGGLPSQP